MTENNRKCYADSIQIGRIGEIFLWLVQKIVVACLEKKEGLLYNNKLTMAVYAHLRDGKNNKSRTAAVLLRCNADIGIGVKTT